MSKSMQIDSIWQWPEFKAFMKRAGLDGLPITDLVITMPKDGIATFDAKILGIGVEHRAPMTDAEKAEWRSRQFWPFTEEETAKLLRGERP